ncbi:cysteine desulfurase CsdA [Photobacterium sp. WH77]|uniref:Probable cysteine desulfurase n=1 Tax=Photobacterium arenosum TaxID=2774143 RepID=A0ABR9BQX8_9GAMM|nr:MULTISPECIES: cysteine desulfurase CsdA [Photobacterium]MBD8514964.1 cysteine desulfurase CsdA [Photobacterium arenosum]MCG2838831.1 cysteine desulfurase CsdA [Photobacterium sp. WH77]MCG2846448.1 cysteine desulfurase CsdA [Photobacterium sp. WH80]
MTIPFDIQAIRSQFPALHDAQHPITFLDSAATTQKPLAMIQSLDSFYRQHSANVHRGSHQLTAGLTQRFEQARETVRQLIHASSPKEIIWTRGATEALNLIAQSWARSTLQPGDEILVSELEHHANIVPWQMVAEQTGATVVKIPMKPDCTLDMDAFHQLLGAKTRIVAVAHITNVTGTRNPIETMITAAHAHGAIVVIDGAQGIVHETVDVQALNADFYVFSGHKLFGPSGIGVLYGKQALLEAMPPWHGGGKMVEKVSFEGTHYTGLPGKFEAGTPNISSTIALAESIHWLNSIDRQGAECHIHALRQKALDGIQDIDGLRIVGLQADASLFSFVVDGIHHQDIATLLDEQGVTLRAGNHCAHPMLDALGLTGTLRVSLALYNTEEDIERFVAALHKACDLL